MGSRPAARRAGYTPNTTPTKAEKPNAIITDVMPTSVLHPISLVKSIAPPAPTAMPMVPPTRQSTMASMRNWKRMLSFVAPSALRMPISRVRW